MINRDGQHQCPGVKCNKMVDHGGMLEKCDECKAKKKEPNALTKLVLNGFCIDCNKEISKKAKRCKDCIKKYEKTYAKQHYKDNRDALLKQRTDKKKRDKIKMDEKTQEKVTEEDEGEEIEEGVEMVPVDDLVGENEIPTTEKPYGTRKDAQRIINDFDKYKYVTKDDLIKMAFEFDDFILNTVVTGVDRKGIAEAAKKFRDEKILGRE